jgi:branched-chain amino acid aminotransferase
MPVEEREIKATEMRDFAECGVCGTAAVISTVASITHDGKEHTYKHDTLLKIKDIYNKIIRGEVEAPEGWLVRI